MSLSVYFENRNFTPYIPKHWERIEVESYSKAAQFGPKRAMLRAYGTNEQVWEFVEMLRCPVYLSDDRPKRVWWGYIHKVDINTAGGYARLECRGWGETLKWQYLNQDKGRESYEELGSHYGREVGEDKRPTCAQSFQISSSDSWTATAIWIRCYSVGTRADNLQVDLWDDSGNTPNASLTGGATTLAYADVPTSCQWVEFILSSSVALSPATTYWIHVSASGAADDEDYYVVDGNENQGYDNGKCLLWNDSDWGEEWPDDLNFIIVGEAETTTQISEAIALDGQFFIGTNILDASGVNSEQYRDGDATTYYEIMQMLDVGTTNNKRLLADVTDKRMVEIYEEPAKGEADYTISGDVMYGVSLDSMTNSIQVPYSYQSERYTTAFSSDSDSIDEYGTKELQVTASNISDTQAEQLRDTELSRKKYPIPTIKTGRGEVNLFDEKDNPLPLTECPAGVWMKLRNVIPGSANISRLSDPSSIFVEEAIYNARDNTYRITKTKEDKPFIPAEIETG